MERRDLRKVGANPNFWYPLALTSEVPRGAMRTAAFAGEPIVLVRGRSGKLFALEDRCAHRQMPLHLGVVRGDRVQCAYHGWTYRDSGEVAAIPYAPAGLGCIRGVRSYPCREAHGFVFVFPGEPARAHDVKLPDLPAWHTGLYVPMHFSRRVGCHYTFMHENLMDMNHQFLHRGLMGRLRPDSLSFDRGNGWVEARYQFTGGQGMHRGAQLLIGKHWSDPTRRNNVMTIRTEYPYQMLELRQRGAESSAFCMLVTYVPVDRDQRANHTLGVLLIRKLRIPGLATLALPLIRRFAESVFAEDRIAVEAEQRAYDEQGEDRNQEISPLILELRDLLLRAGVGGGAASDDKESTRTVSCGEEPLMGCRTEPEPETARQPHTA
jgi:phenylpropionate dioxygenase-like ring-hydroxylating dioxygenase large terminal subunit